MSRSTSFLVLGALVMVGVAGGVGIGKSFASLPSQDRPETPVSVLQLQDAFNRVSDFATRSVVHITTGGSETQPFDPLDFWHRPMPLSIGSGVIVSKDGHILTNHHVVRGNQTCKVRFVDGREFEGAVVGEDPESDLSLVKIDPKGMDLQPIPFGDSDKVRVGDWVIAIGSPFGYNHTVTAGIVSAKHRQTLLNQAYQDFIQTDAAINPGNSGGALVNVKGELVGINSAIISQTRTWEGIGLAIASNLALSIKDRLMKDGRVRRGWMGIWLQDINDNLIGLLREDFEGVRSLQDLLADLGLEAPRGVFIYNPQQPRRSVEPNSPAARAGLRAGDVIVEFNGKKVTGTQDLFFRVAECEPGQKVAVTYLRDRKKRSVTIELAERPGREPSTEQPATERRR